MPGITGIVCIHRNSKNKEIGIRKYWVRRGGNICAPLEGILKVGCIGDYLAFPIVYVLMTAWIQVLPPGFL